MLIQELLKVKRKSRDVSWLKDALRTAIQLEFFTIPPYLCALWSIKRGGEDVARRIRRIVKQEMLHMGLACNMLVALDPPGDSNAAFPPLSDRKFVPAFPSPLPGIGDGSLIVGLAPLSKEIVEHVFMRIEYPQKGPVPTFSLLSQTIGGFYEGIREAFEKENPTLHKERQREDGRIELEVLATLDKVKEAIGTIVGQGEGKPGPDTSSTPCAGEPVAKCPLAHYYQFKEVLDEKEYEWDGKKLHVRMKDGHPVPVVFPSKVHPMAVVPCGGHPYDAMTMDGKPVPELKQFDEKYTDMLKKLEAAWKEPDWDKGQALLKEAVDIMNDDQPGGLTRLANVLMTTTAGKIGNYGPNFRVV